MTAAAPRHRIGRGAALVVAAGVALRLPGLFRPSLDFDESFTALAARRSPVAAVRFVRAFDAHPPLDLVLRGAQVRLGLDAWVVRLPTLVLAVAGLVVLARWLWPRGVAGRAGLVVFTAASTQVHWATEARPVALLLLASPVLVVAADRLCDDGRLRWVVVGALAGLVAAWSHGAGFLLPAAGIGLVGVDRRARAWWWRGQACAVLGVWAVGWALVSPAQGARQGPVGSWAVRRDAMSVAISEQLVYQPFLRWAVVVAVAVGALVLHRSDRQLGRTALAFAPFTWCMAFALTPQANLAQPKALVGLGLGVALGVAGLIDLAWRRWRPFGAVAAAVVAIAMLPTVRFQLHNDTSDRGVPAVTAAGAALEPGDVLVFAPARLDTLPAWQLGLRDREVEPVVLEVDGAARGGLRRRGGPTTGRVLVLAHPDLGLPTKGQLADGTAAAFPAGYLGRWVDLPDLVATPSHWGIAQELPRPAEG